MKLHRTEVESFPADLPDGVAVVQVDEGSHHAPAVVFYTEDDGGSA